MKKFACMSLLVLAVFTACGYGQEPVANADKSDITGYWSGLLPLGPQQRNSKVIFEFNRNPDGSWTAYLHRVDEDQLAIPFSAVSFKDGKLGLQASTFLNAIRGTYDGIMNEAGTAFTGTWIQRGTTRKVPLEVQHVAEVPELILPQEPKPPYPYSAEEVTFDNPQAGVKLAGTLTKPPGPGPFPAVILVQNPGTDPPKDRNRVVGGGRDEPWMHKPFLVLADHLTRHGMAVLRLDDRGVGGSTGTPSDAAPEELANDVLEGVRYLKTRAGINPLKLGLVGYGEGGVVAPLCATRSNDVRFVVLMAARGVTGHALSMAQVLSLPKGQERDGVLQSMEAIGEIEDIWAEEQDTRLIEQKVRAVWTRLLNANMPPNLQPGPEMDRLKGITKKLVDGVVKGTMRPAFRSFITFDPAPTLAAVKCPVLAVHGELDEVMPARLNLRAIETALKAGGNRDYTVKSLPQINSAFQTAQAGERGAALKVGETIAPGVLTLISDWIQQHAAAAPYTDIGLQTDGAVFERLSAVRRCGSRAWLHVPCWKCAQRPWLDGEACTLWDLYND